MTRPDFVDVGPSFDPGGPVPLLRLVAGVRPCLRRALPRLRVPPRGETPSGHAAAPPSHRRSPPHRDSHGRRVSRRARGRVPESPALTRRALTRRAPRTPLPPKIRRPPTSRSTSTGSRTGSLLFPLPRVVMAACSGGGAGSYSPPIRWRGRWHNRPPMVPPSPRARSRPGTSPRRRSSPSWRACST